MKSEKIAILTDSCADLTPELIDNAPVYLLPLNISCPDGEFDDGVTIFARDIYARQRMGQLPKTSLPAGATVEAAFDRIQADGYNKVVAVLLSSGLSGTYNLVRILSQSREDLEVAAFDSLSGAIGEGAIVLQLADDLDHGMGWEELTQTRVPYLIERTFPFFSVDTLEYLVKGGRIGKITALAGTMLNIKPLITFAEDGQLVSVAKVRGRKAVANKFLELVREKIGGHKRYNLIVANGGAAEEMAELQARMAAEFPNYDHFWAAELDATLSVYIGAGVLGAGAILLD